MALVLAFGVQGIADAALTAKKSTDNPDFIETDNRTASAVNKFTFTVTATSADTSDTITINPGTATITNITATGFTRTNNAIAPTSDTSVTDGDTTVTVSYTVTTHGQYDFKVGADLTIFTAYALVSDRARSSITAGTSTPQVNGQGADQPFAVTIAPWTQVDLSVSGGGFIISSDIPHY